jgi:hypothetical protein
MREQLTFVDHLSSLIAQQTEQRIPYAIDSEAAAKILNISKSTLSRAKRQGLLPYSRPSEGWIAVVEFYEQRAGKDYWKVYFKPTES